MVQPAVLEAWKKTLDGQYIGPYRLLSYLGSGHFGLVYEAELANKLVAVKCLIPNGDLADQIEFDNEGRLLRKLESATNVVAYVESGQQDIKVHTEHLVPLTMPIKYHVLELASGCLDEFLVNAQNRHQLKWSDRLVLWRGIVRGVHQMHLKGVVHRDIKSANCLVFLGGSSRRLDCKVADLGRSKDLSIAPTLDPLAYARGMGDLRFAPPEYIWLTGLPTAESHKSADLFGLGSALFEMAHGVGITSYALGTTDEAVRRSFEDRRRGRGYDAGALRPQFEAAYEAFGEQLPKAIRSRATDLLARLCDPEPNMRLSQPAGHRRVPPQPALEALFKEIDILAKTCSISERRASNTSGKK